MSAGPDLDVARRVQALVLLGHTDTEIGDLLGRSRHAVAHLRRRTGLPANQRERKVLEPGEPKLRPARRSEPAPLKGWPSEVQPIRGSSLAAGRCVLCLFRSSAVADVLDHLLVAHGLGRVKGERPAAVDLGTGAA